MTIHARLKRDTSFDHQRIECCLDLLSPALSTPDYVNVLRAFYGFYRPLETRLQHAVTLFPALRLAIPRRAELLANDLEAMGASRQAIAAVPTCEHLPPLASPAQIAGCVYVLEGASLGGLVIARAVERSVGVSRHRGASFFAGPGTGHAVGARWKSTLDWLEEVVRSGSEPSLIVDSARHTFRAFHDWLVARKCTP